MAHDAVTGSPPPDDRDAVSPRHLRVAARISDGLVYAVGVAGIAAGGAVYLEAGSVGLAVAVWVLTFVAGGVLRLAAWAARALATLLEQVDDLTERVSDLGDRERGGPRPWGQPPSHRPPWPPQGEGPSGAEPPDPPWWRAAGGR